LGYYLSNDPDSAGRLPRPSGTENNEWRSIGACASSSTVFCGGHDLFAECIRGPGHWQLLFEGYLDELHSQISIDALLGSEDFLRRPVDKLKALAGAYTLVAWNTQTGEVIATRDRTGARTVYFTEHGGHLTLATSSDWVVRVSGRPRREEPRFIVSLFALQQAPPPGLSAFKGVRELMPGDVLQFGSGKLAVTHTPRDFDALVRAGQVKRRPDDWADEFFHLLNNAVVSCLPPEGDAACMLSGGLDSGPTAVLADEHLRPQGRAVRPISWSLHDFPACDEAKWIHQSASRLYHPLDLCDLSHALPFSRLDSTVVIPDLPIYNGFRLLVNDCYQRARAQRCSVLLNASTGDQIYPHRRWLHLDRLRRRQWSLLRNDLLAAARVDGLSGLFNDPAVRFPLARHLLPWRHRARAPAWLQDSAKALWQAPSSWPPEAKSTPEPAFARQLFGAPMAFGVAHEAPMAQRHGVDRRDPFQNEALLEFMLKAPFDLSWRSGYTKAIMRRAMRGRLPESILMKDRTGRLEDLYQSGIRANRETIKTLLFDQQLVWQQYVHPDSMRAILSWENQGQSILLASCTGYSLWKKQFHTID